MSTIVDIANLIKNSQGCINIHEAEDLEFFEFLVYSDYFETDFNQKEERQQQDKIETNELIIEGIKSIYTALRG